MTHRKKVFYNLIILIVKGLQHKNTGDFSPLTPSKTTGARLGGAGFDDPSKKNEGSP